jgi:hypothetical protein
VVATPTVAPTAGAAGGSFGAARNITFVGLGEIDPKLIQDIYTNSYQAGEVGPGAVRVRVVTLTVNSLK